MALTYLAKPALLSDECCLLFFVSLFDYSSSLLMDVQPCNAHAIVSARKCVCVCVCVCVCARARARVLILNHLASDCLTVSLPSSLTFAFVSMCLCACACACGLWLELSFSLPLLQPGPFHLNCLLLPLKCLVLSVFGCVSIITEPLSVDLSHSHDYSPRDDSDDKH